VLALCLGVTAMAFLRLPNLMIASVVLWLFFFYDIFWVFLSAQFFGKNVMYPALPQIHFIFFFISLLFTLIPFII
jgi:hypothetical protein